MRKIKELFFSASKNTFILKDWKTDGTYSAETWPADAVEASEEEVNTYWKVPPPGKSLGSEGGRPVWVDLPAPSLEDIAGSERSWRNGELAAVMWLRERHRDQQEIGGDTTLSQVQFAELLIYMQALRDWPQSPYFPESERRPVAPPWIADQAE
ncbi:phage tail assembly chaperone [Pseudomonas syringae]